MTISPSFMLDIDFAFVMHDNMYNAYVCCWYIWLYSV